jgi:BirA family biotin operon repressor/biotin-[acetyl-CoA-carboxylase] ligase
MSTLLSTGATYRSGVDAAQPGTRFRVRHVGETGSTNADLLAAAHLGEPEGLVLVADHQRAGRGRMGRTWEAPAGSALLASVLLRPPPIAVHMAVIAVGCAAASACAAAGPGLKWPNDLVIGDRKLGGILAEATASSENVTAVVVGLGLNLYLPPDFPAELRESAAALDGSESRDEVLAALLVALESRYAALCASGPADLLDEYRRRCVTLGRRVRVEQTDVTWEGVAVGIDNTGALEVERPGVGAVRVDVGDVVHLRAL